MSLRINEGWAEAIRQVMQLSGENTKAGDIDAALHHFVRDYRTKENLVDELDPKIAEKLSKPELPVEISTVTSVGIDKD